MRAYAGRFTKLLSSCQRCFVDRAIDAFSDGIRRETYIEELGRKKPKTITKLMEIANSWADGEDNVRRPRQRSDNEDDNQPKNDSGGRRDRRKKRKDRSYDDNNLVAAGYSDRQDDRFIEISSFGQPRPYHHLHLGTRSGKFTSANESFPPPRGKMSMIHRTGVSRRKMKKLTQEINLAESIMANIPEYIDWSSRVSRSAGQITR
ncbi:hypothetical protein QYE76_040173 [Lolium multiflorum]|uniref:Uncharacterized protein n=1 Tax=Lolium multiflorum TaxID=4521 RepID=A0AAD8TAQ5_LOLMU|nr:hypothetical protein QYE76_040173 [Lolium multiflorum]